MTTKEKTDYFKRKIDFESIGFIEVQEESEFLYVKTQNNISVFIICTFFRNKFQSAGFWITCNEIENLLREFYSKFQLEPDRIRPMTISSSKFLPNTAIFPADVDLLFDSYDNIEKVALTVKSCVIEIFKPIWEKYADLQTINDELIDQIPQMKLSDFISGKMSTKKLIIMKMCKNDNYEEYKSWLIKNYENEYQKGNEQADNEYFMMKDLVEYLETI